MENTPSIPPNPSSVPPADPASANSSSAPQATPLISQDSNPTPPPPAQPNPTPNQDPLKAPKSQDPLGDYFKQIDNRPTPPVSQPLSVENITPNIQPALPNQSVSNTPVVKAKKFEDPLVIQARRDRRKLIIKWVIVAINFILMGLLLYYYFIYSQKPHLK